MVDRYGDNVVGQTLQGDGFRKRHDHVKRKILSLLRWAGVDVECEVFNLFARLIPQQGLSRLERGRKRQGMVADFRVRLPGEEVGVEGAGGAVSVLAELKDEGIVKLPDSLPARPPRPREGCDEAGEPAAWRV